MRKVVLLTLVAVIISLSGCTPETENPATPSKSPVKVSTLASDIERVASPVVAETDKSSLADGNSAFAFDLYRQLKDGEGNLFFSPYCISLVLAMAYAGARGETEKQMAEALHFNLPQDGLHAAFNWLSQELESRGQGNNAFRLNIANALWGKKGVAFLESFLDTMAAHYGSGLNIMDFNAEPEKSRVTINDWVSEQTEGKIKDIIPRGAIDKATRLIATSAIYFDADWEFKFNKANTSPGAFHFLDGTTANVTMMKQKKTLKYCRVGNYRVLELPYVGRQLSMVVLLPDEGEFLHFEESLNSANVTSIIGQMKSVEVAIALPKFEFDSSFDLRAVLSAMGMPLAFNGVRADFSGIITEIPLCMEMVLHKAFVSVDEDGTEAAAVAVVEWTQPTSSPDEPEYFIADRPFIFFIRDIRTGAILFIGRVLDPS